MRRFNLRRFEAAAYDRITYLCRYAHVPWSEAIGLTRDQADNVQAALGRIVAREMGDKT